MSVIDITPYEAEVVWCGAVNPDAEGVRSDESASLDLTWEGTFGARHAGRTRPSCVRVRKMYKEGTEIANTRQLSILSLEELDAMAAEIGIDAMKPEWLGASLIVKGIPDFSFVPPSSRLQGPDGVALVFDMYNEPCIYPGKELEKDLPGLGKKFKPAAKDRRGVTAWVERPGKLTLGDKLRLIVPNQRPWNPTHKI